MHYNALHCSSLLVLDKSVQCSEAVQQCIAAMQQFSSAMQQCSSAAVQCSSAAVLQCSSAVVQCNTVVQHCSSSAIQQCSSAKQLCIAVQQWRCEEDAVTQGEKHSNKRPLNWTVLYSTLLYFTSSEIYWSTLHKIALFALYCMLLHSPALNCTAL